MLGGQSDDGPELDHNVLQVTVLVAGGEAFINSLKYFYPKLIILSLYLILDCL